MAARSSTRGAALAASALAPLLACLIVFVVFVADPGCYSGGPTGEGAQGGPDGAGTGFDGGRGPDGSRQRDAASGSDGRQTFGDGGAPMCPLAFSTDTPGTYVAKVKNLLVGLPPTNEEVASVADGGTPALSTLVDTWMTGTAPGIDGGAPYNQLYQAKLLRFFELAFQQTQVTTSDFENQLNPGQLQIDGNRATAPLLLQNQEEMFARTMIALDLSGTPFNKAIATKQYMMTTALKAFFGLTDVWQLNDSVQGVVDSFAAANPTVTLTVSKGPTSMTDLTTWHFYDPDLVITGGCADLQYQGQANFLWEILVGAFPADAHKCTGAGAGQLLPGDFSDWTMVTMSQPAAVTPFPFYALSSFRAGGASYASMALDRPYLGFFTTPAFFANWPTNASNEMRVTTNQSLIVATGAMIDINDPTSLTVDASAYGLQSSHATPGSPCFSCHWLLDPTREIFARSFSWYYGAGLQVDGGGAAKGQSIDFLDQPAYFAFEGVQGPMATMTDFGTQLSNHPLLPTGWAQKLCYYINSGPCVDGDPAFEDIVSAFKGSGGSQFSFSQLIKAVVTSPVTTHTKATVSVTGNRDAAGNCEPVAVARRDHLCAALNARLGFADICGLNASIPTVFANTNPLNIMPGLPSDGYGRGSTAPVLPNAPSLFYRAGVENFCEYVSELVIDNPTPPAGATTWSSAQCNATSCSPIGTSCTGSGSSCTAPGDFVTLVAGLPSDDPRAPLLAGALFAHFNAALADLDAGTSPTKPPTKTEALRSAFVAACMAPSAISIGL